jgi:hypothetical protein
VLDTIDASTGVRLNAPSNWWFNLSLWSGRWITVVAPDDLSAHQLLHRDDIVDTAVRHVGDRQVSGAGVAKESDLIT